MHLFHCVLLHIFGIVNTLASVQYWRAREAQQQACNAYIQAKGVVRGARMDKTVFGFVPASLGRESRAAAWAWPRETPS